MSIADKLTTIAENVSKVYQAGYDKGVAEGGDEAVFQQGYEAGKTAEWNAMWDAIQINGTRTYYGQVFANAGWTKEAFKPKYNITPTGADSCFWKAFINEPEPVDLVELLEKAGVELDLSQCTNNQQIFDGANIKRIGVINASASGNSTRFLFRNATKLETVESLILRGDSSMNTSYMFLSCNSLKNINHIEGVFGVSFELMQSTLLSKQTIINIINALSPTTSGLSFSAKRIAVNNAFETAEGLADGSTSAEWLALVATKPNWTISLS